MSDLKQALGEAASAAFAAEGVDAAFGRVTASDRPDLADFQCNGALAAAKAMRANPRELAAKVLEHQKGDARLASIEIAGPGFINFKLTDAALGQQAQAISDNTRVGAETVAEPRRVVIDYGGPGGAGPGRGGRRRAAGGGGARK